MRSSPLPDSLGVRFRTSDARDAGVPPGRLRAGDLRRPFFGVRGRIGDDPNVVTADPLDRPRGRAEQDHVRRALDFAARMGADQFFSHATAAILYGWPVSAGAARGDIHVGVFAPARLPRIRGVRGHEATTDTTRTAVDPRTGLRVTSPATTWAMLGATTPDIRDLVALGDAAVRDWRVARPLATVAELAAAVTAGRRVGIGRLREALPLVRTRSASRPETWCRLTLVFAGLPEPDANLDVLVDGRVVACVDLAYPSARIAIEYEGEHHLLDPRQWAHDIERHDILRAAGWTVIRVTKTELFDEPHRLVARVRQALSAR